MTSLHASAETADCFISIDSGNTKYTVDATFNYRKGDVAGHRKTFEIPNAQYSCMLTFFGLEIGTMVSCKYTLDLGDTFFQSDRTVINEANPKNNLMFKHNGNLVVIKTQCN